MWNLHKLRPQPIYAGPTIINTNFLVCEICWSPPNPNLQTIILPPDPPPVFNARPEPYFLDEVDLLSTQNDDPLVTQSDVEIVTNQPSQNFSDPPGT